MAKNKEYELQKSVVKYIRFKYPQILYCASAGGVRTSMSQAIKMKATGYVKGFPDLFIYEPLKGFNGLAIELKVKGNYPTKEQKSWAVELNDRGYKACICTGLDDAINCINRYFE
jgi:hypothetical protein